MQGESTTFMHNCNIKLDRGPGVEEDGVKDLPHLSPFPPIYPPHHFATTLLSSCNYTKMLYCCSVQVCALKSSKIPYSLGGAEQGCAGGSDLAHM